MRKPAFSNRKADQRHCFRYIARTILLLPKSEFSSLQSSAVTVQPGLCLIRSETPKTGFLTMRLTFMLILFSISRNFTLPTFTSTWPTRPAPESGPWRSLWTTERPGNHGSTSPTRLATARYSLTHQSAGRSRLIMRSFVQQNFQGLSPWKMERLVCYATVTLYFVFLVLCYFTHKLHTFYSSR